MEVFENNKRKFALIFLGDCGILLQKLIIFVFQTNLGQFT